MNKKRIKNKFISNSIVYYTYRIFQVLYNVLIFTYETVYQSLI